MFHQLLLALLQGQDFLFHRVACDKFVDEDGFILPDAVRAVAGLLLDGGIPPGVEVDDVIGGGEIQPQPAGLETDKEERDFGVFLELVYLLLPVARLPVEIGIRNFLRVQLLA